MTEISRIDRIKIALHDLGSRKGATAKGVMKELKKLGYSTQEINEAVKQMSGQ